MKDIIVWAIHAPAGTIGLITAVVAIFSQKGSDLHRKAGRCFTRSMMVMLISGIAIALLKNSADDLMLAVFVMYTVFTAWLTVHRKQGETGKLEYLALSWILVAAAASFSLSTGWREVQAPVAYLFWGGFAVLCAVGDIWNLYKSGVTGVQRVIRHVWRIGFSLVWAALAFTDKIVKMVGDNLKEMPEEQLMLIVAVPTTIVFATIIYWIANILIFSRKKYTGYGETSI